MRYTTRRAVFRSSLRVLNSECPRQEVHAGVGFRKELGAMGAVIADLNLRRFAELSAGMRDGVLDGKHDKCGSDDRQHGLLVVVGHRRVPLGKG